MSMEFYSEHWGKARKPHKCECCGWEIKIGEEYCRQSGKFYREFFDRAYCVTCEGLVRDYCHEVDNEFDYDSVIDHAQGKFCEKCGDNGWWNDGECDHYIYECPKVIEHYKQQRAKYKEQNNG